MHGPRKELQDLHKHRFQEVIGGLKPHVQDVATEASRKNQRSGDESERTKCFQSLLRHSLTTLHPSPNVMCSLFVPYTLQSQNWNCRGLVHFEVLCPCWWPTRVAPGWQHSNGLGHRSLGSPGCPVARHSSPPPGPPRGDKSRRSPGGPRHTAARCGGPCHGRHRGASSWAANGCPTSSPHHL